MGILHCGVIYTTAKEHPWRYWTSSGEEIKDWQTCTFIRSDRSEPWYVEFVMSPNLMHYGPLIIRETDERNGDDMSKELQWRPGSARATPVGWALWRALENYFSDGMPEAVVFVDYDLSLLRGMKAAGVQEAQKLIDAINEHGSVIITQEIT